MILTRMTPDQVEALARGRGRVVAGDRSRPPRSVKLTTEEYATFKRSKKFGYLIWTSSQPNLYEIWFYWCRATDAPFVAVKAKRKWGSIEFEMNDPEVELTDSGVATVAVLLELLIPDPIWGCHRRQAFQWNLPLAGIDDLAARLVRVTRVQVRRCQR